MSYIKLRPSRLTILSSFKMVMLRGYLILLITINILPYLTSEQICNETSSVGGAGATENMINRSEQIQSIANYILSQLGFSQPPNASSTDISQDKVTDYQMQKRREANTHDCDSENSNAISVNTIKGKPLHLQSASESGSGSDTKRASGDHYIGGDVILASYDFEFNIAASHYHKHPHLVELMVYKEKSHCIHDNSFRDQLVDVAEKSNTSSLSTVIAVKLVDACSPKGYVRFNITKAAIRWFQQKLNKISLTLTVKCISSCQCELKSEQIVRFSTSSKTMKVPHLVMETYVQHATQIKRRKRNTRYNFCSNSSQTCCLRQLTVNFKKDLGWNFVKLPTEIYVNYCGGFCLLGTDSTPSHFDVLAGIHSSTYPCCSGATYEPVTMLIDDGSGTLDVLELPKMTVTSCQCG